MGEQDKAVKSFILEKAKNHKQNTEKAPHYLIPDLYQNLTLALHLNKILIPTVVGIRMRG